MKKAEKGFIIPNLIARRMLVFFQILNSACDLWYKEPFDRSHSTPYSRQHQRWTRCLRVPSTSASTQTAFPPQSSTPRRRISRRSRSSSSSWASSSWLSRSVGGGASFTSRLLSWYIAWSHDTSLGLMIPNNSFRTKTMILFFYFVLCMHFSQARLFLIEKMFEMRW